MAMYVEMFRTIINYRHKKGYLYYAEFIKLRRQVALMDYEMRKVHKKFKMTSKEKGKGGKSN